MNDWDEDRKRTEEATRPLWNLERSVERKLENIELESNNAKMLDVVVGKKKAQQEMSFEREID